MSNSTENLIRRIDRYVIQERIGSGGMARVYRALDTALQRDVAIKVLHDHLADDNTFRARFEREARFLASFNHPNVVQIFDYATMEVDNEHLVYMVMTYLPGQTLKAEMDETCERGDLMPQERILKITQDIAAALDYAHELGMVHRDVKPANILFDDKGRAVLTDFGISRMIEGSTLTQENVAVGTPAYMAPEQAAGEDVDARTDIYALGIILYELLAGKPPFGNDGSISVLLKHLNEPVPSLTELDHIQNEYLDAVIYKALAKNPNNRYQSAGELAQDLARVLANQKPALKEDIETLRTMCMPVATRPMTTPAPQKPRRRNSPMGILMMGLTAILVLLISAFVIEQLTGDDAAPSLPNVATITPTLAPNEFRNFGGIDSMVEEPDAAVPSMTVLQNTPVLSEFGADDSLVGLYWPLNAEADENGNDMIQRERGENDTYIFSNGIANRAATTILMDYEYTTDISIIADVTLHANSPDNSGYGVVFHYTNPVNFGVFAVDGNGNFSIWYLIEGEWSELRDADEDWTRSEAVNPTGEPNRLRLDIRGATLTGFVNGQQVTQVESGALMEGGVGFYLATPRTGGESVLIADRYEVIVAGDTGVSSMTSDSSDPTPESTN